MTLTPEERRCYADQQWDSRWRGYVLGPVLERLWEAYVALDMETDQLAELVRSLEQQRADLAEELAAVKGMTHEHAQE